MRDVAQHTRAERGQATAEFLGVVPVLLLVALATWQLTLAGQTTWLAGNAARVGARAAAVGEDPAAAARSALPSDMRQGLRVSAREGRVSVRVRMPIVMRGRPSPLRIGASAGLPQR